MERPHSLKHKHFRFKATIKNPPKDELAGVEFMKKLVAGVGMEMAVLSRGQQNPIVWYSEPESNQGMTLTAILTTSNAALHIWDQEKVLQFDLYSCQDFTCADVVALVDQYVGIDEIIWKDYTDRETGDIRNPILLQKRKTA